MSSCGLGETAPAPNMMDILEQEEKMIEAMDADLNAIDGALDAVVNTNATVAEQEAALETAQEVLDATAGAVVADVVQDAIDEMEMPDLAPVKGQQVQTKLMSDEQLQCEMAKVTIHDAGHGPQEPKVHLTAKQKADLIYYTNNSIYGSKVHQNKNAQSRYGLAGRFTDHLIASGMYKNNSLNTATTRNRFMDHTTDWMLKID